MAKQTFPQTTVRLGIHGREHSAEASVNVSPGKLVGQQELSIDVYRGPVLDTKNFPIKLRFTRKDALLLAANLCKAVLEHEEAEREENARMAKAKK